jgi:uncharacterized coiled-coil protein SlyX
MGDGKGSCNFNETGVCSMHNIEIERRQDAAQNIKNFVRNTFGIIVIVMVASFSYTAINKNATDAADTELRQSVTDLRDVVHELSVMVAHDRGRVDPLIEQLRELNENLSTIKGKT